MNDFKTYLLDPQDPRHKKKSNNTISAYLTTEKEFLDKGKVADSDKLTEGHINNYLDFLNANGLKHNTKLLKVAGLRAYLKFKGRKDLTGYTEDIEFRKEKGYKKNVNYPEIFDQIEELRKRPALFKNCRDRLIFALLSEGGLRVSEALSLTLEDFDLKNKVIKIWQTKQETEAEIELTKNIENALKEYVAYSKIKNKLFNSLSRQGVDHILKSYAIDKKLRPEHKLSSHRLRHYFVSKWAKILPAYLLMVKSRHTSLGGIKPYVNLGARDVDAYVKENRVKKPF